MEEEQLEKPDDNRFLCFDKRMRLSGGIRRIICYPAEPDIIFSHVVRHYVRV